MDIEDENNYLIERNLYLEDLLVKAKQIIFKLKRQNLEFEEQIFIIENVKDFVNDLKPSTNNELI